MSCYDVCKNLSSSKRPNISHHYSELIQTAKPVILASLEFMLKFIFSFPVSFYLGYVMECSLEQAFASCNTMKP